MNLIQIKQIEGLAAYIQENVPAVMEGYHVVYQTGDQTISGAKTFTGPILITGDSTISGTFTSSGVSYFDDNVYISGELWITGSDGTPVQITGNGGGGGGDPENPNTLYTTGTQEILGGKKFLSRITGYKGFYITGDHSLNNAYLENTFLQIDTGPNNNRGLQVSKGTSNTPSLSIYNYEGTEGTTPAEMMSGSALLYAGNTHTKHLTITNATKSGDIRFFTVGDRDDYLSDFDWYDPASQRLIIASGGNVGIGVTGIHQGTALSVNPLERLHVSGGNFRVDGNSYVSGELWITGTGGYPIQITGNGGGGGGSIGDYITALGISGYNLSGNTLWVGDGGAHISGDSAIDGDLTLLGTFYLTGGATVGEADGDNVFLVGTTAGGLPRIGMGEFPDVDSIEELVHISGGNLKLQEGNFEIKSGQITSTILENDTLNAIFKKDYVGAPEPKSSLSIYNYDSAEAGVASDLGVGPMLYAVGHHLTVTNVTETGDIRFFTLGSEDGSAGDWYDPAQQRLIIHSGGNVGIGVTGLDPTNPDLSVAPLEKLHVSGGNFRVDGNAYISGQLWITGEDGAPLQITGNGGGGGGSSTPGGLNNSIQYNDSSSLGGLPVIYYKDYGENDADSTDADTFNSGALVLAGNLANGENCKAIISSGSNSDTATGNFGVIFRRIDHPLDDTRVNESIILGSYPGNGGWSADGIADNSESYSVLAADIESKKVVINGPPGYRSNDVPGNIQGYDVVVYSSDYDEPGIGSNVIRQEMGVIKAGSIFATGLNSVLTQLKPFGLNSTDITTDYTLDSSRNNQIIHFDPNTDVEITLPTTDDFIDFKFTARHVNNLGNYVGFKSDDASTVHGTATGFNSEHAWATIYRGNGDWYIYGDPLVNIGPAPTTPAPVTTTTATPVTTTTATPTTTPEPSPDLLKDGLMMRFFAWDDPDSDRESSFSSSESVNINGVVESRSVLYPSYKSPLLPQMTGAVSDNTTFATWSDAAKGITDSHGTAKSGIHFTNSIDMQFPQIQDDADGGQWSSFNGAMDFLTGITEGWTVAFWMNSNFSSNPALGTDNFKVYELGGDGNPTNVGLFYNFSATNDKIYIRGSNTDYIYAQQASEGAGVNSVPEIIRATTGNNWTFHAFSYGGGGVEDPLANNNENGGNIMWTVGTGNPSSNQAQFFSGDYTSTPAGILGGLGVAGGTYYEQYGGNGIDSFLKFNDDNATMLGDAGNDPLTAAWPGYISDFRIYSGALSTGQLNSIYTGEGLV